MRNSLMVIMILLMCQVSLANDSENPVGRGKITGIVVDKVKDIPIEYTNVVLFRSQDSTMLTGTITDHEGRFSINDIPSGQYYLQINFIGFNKKEIQGIEINRTNHEISLEKIMLERAIENLDDVEVISDRNYVDFKIDKKVVNVSQHINAAGGTAAQVLENVPSVQVDIEGNVSLRGSTNYTVLVDGRPSILSGPDLLKQLPANTIENIEIITNPSAKYDPDGTAGIINIIMKKQKLEGMNGMINLSAGTNGKYGADFNVNLKRKRSNLFVSANYNLNTFLSETTNKRESYLSDTVSFLTEQTDRRNETNPWRFTLGTDYYLTENTTLTLSGAVGGFGMNRLFETEYHQWDTITDIHKCSHSVNEFNIDGIYYTGTANLHHKFSGDGHTLNVSLTAWNWDSDNTQHTEENLLSSDGVKTGDPKLLKTLDQVYRENMQFKLDYTKPLAKGKLEAGLFAHVSPGDSEFLFEDYDSELDKWIPNLTYTNSMNFRRDLYSAYSTYSNQLAGFQYQMGLRLEYTDRLLEQVTMNEKWPVEIFNYYPSVHISRQLKKDQQIQLSYSRRIDRPQPWDFNPFPGYNDSYNSFTGNPLLKPADTDALEFNYIKRIKLGMLSSTAFFRQSRNTKVMAIKNTEDHLMVITWENLGRINATGIETMANLNLTQWCNLNIGANAYYLSLQGTLLDQELDQESLSFDGRVSATFKIGKMTRLQAMAFYQSARAEGQGIKEDDFITSFALRHEFLKRRASVSLSIRDPFNTHYYNTSTRTDDFYSSFSMDGESATIRISFSYRLNDYQRRRNDANIEVGGGM